MNNSIGTDKYNWIRAASISIFILISSIILISVLFSISYMNNIKNDFSQVSYSGKQRMLAQRVAFLVNSYVVSFKYNDEKKLTELSNKIDSSINELRETHKVLSIRYFYSKKLEGNLEGLRNTINNISKDWELFNASNDHDKQVELIISLSSSVENFYEKMEKVDNVITNISKRNTHSFIEVIVILGLVAFFLIAISIYFIFAPILKMYVHLIQEEVVNKTRRREFLAHLNHEIRTPVTGIIGEAELLQHSELTDSQSKLAESIYFSSKTLLSLLNNLIEFEEFKTVSSDLSLSKIDIKSFILEIEKVYQSRLEEKSVSLMTELGVELPKYIFVDEEKLTQVILYLINRSIDSSNGDRAILLTLDKKDSVENDFLLLEFKITDSGENKDSSKNNFKDEIFNSTKSKLGVEICSSLVNMLGGELKIGNQYSTGDSFTFKVALKDSDLEGITNDATEEVETTLSKHVLIVEDDIVNQKVVAKMLETGGHSFELASNGQEAVDKFSDNSFDLILMDIEMPIMNGIEATKKIREMNGGDLVTIVALTAKSIKGDKEKILENGLDNYLEKPCNRKALLKQVSQVE